MDLSQCNNQQALQQYIHTLSPEAYSLFRKNIYDHHMVAISSLDPALYCDILSEHDTVLYVYNYLNIPYIMDTNPQAWMHYVHQYPMQAFLGLYLDLHNYMSRIERPCYQEAVRMFTEHHTHDYRSLSFILSALLRGYDTDKLARLARRYTSHETPIEQLLSIAFQTPFYVYNDDIKEMQRLAQSYTGGASLEALFLFLQVAAYASLEYYQPIFQHFSIIDSTFLMEGLYESDCSTHDIFDYFPRWAQDEPIMQEDSLFL